MKLSVGERITLLGLIRPMQGKRLEIHVLKKVMGELPLSKEEETAVGLKQVGETLSWDSAKDPNKEIEIGEITKRKVLEALRALEEAGDLTMAQSDLYDRLDPLKEEAVK